MRTALLVLVALAAGCTTAATPPIAPAAPAAPASNDDALVQATNDGYVDSIRASIAGRENEPSEQVFRNVQWLKGIPAERFLRIMNGGYSRALGVTCTHCHVESDFASDEKRPKRAAREMAVMYRSINTQLKTMQNLASNEDQRAISCVMCHRGEVNPRESR
jgi:formate-dependent nitrite reductase cytochrome c552 subunit